jgi:hypothetical protein
MKRFSVVGSLTAMLALGGCKMLDGGEFAGSTPTAENVALAIPASGNTQSALTAGDGTKVSALLGEEADSYKLTRAVTGVVNGATGLVLILVKTIVSFPPTTVDGDTAVWGPHSEPLDKNAWRLTVTRLEPHVFSWALDGKAKNADDSTFITILSGTHTRAVNGRGRPIENYGSGTFLVDWDAAQTLPDHDNAVGVATFVYSRTAPDAVTTIDVDFKGIKDDPPSTELYDAIYRYTATPGAGGDLKYAAKRDYYPEQHASGSAKEDFTIHSRWQQTGTGRTDYQLTGGDVATDGLAPVTVSECWDTSFVSTYRVLSYDPTDVQQNWGAETSCSFPNASFLAPSL